MWPSLHPKKHIWSHIIGSNGWSNPESNTLIGQEHIISWKIINCVPKALGHSGTNSLITRTKDTFLWQEVFEQLCNEVSSSSVKGEAQLSQEISWARGGRWVPGRYYADHRNKVSGHGYELRDSSGCPTRSAMPGVQSPRFSKGPHSCPVWQTHTGHSGCHVQGGMEDLAPVLGSCLLFFPHVTFLWLFSL